MSNYFDRLFIFSNRYATFTILAVSCAGKRIGQNAHFSSKSFKPADTVAMWTSEIDDWEFSTQSCKEGKVCGHWTQVETTVFVSTVGHGFPVWHSNEGRGD